MENKKNMGNNEDSEESKLKVFAKHHLKKMGLSLTSTLGMRKSFSKIVDTLNSNNEEDMILIKTAAYWRVTEGMHGASIAKDIEQIKYTNEIVDLVFDGVTSSSSLESASRDYGENMHVVLDGVDKGLEASKEHREYFNQRFLEDPNSFMKALLIADGPGADKRLQKYCNLAFDNLDSEKKESLARVVRENIHNIGFNQAKYFLSKGDTFFPEDTKFKKDWANGDVSLNCTWASEAILKGNPAFALAWEDSGRKINLHDVAISNKLRNHAVSLYPRGVDESQAGKNVMAYATGNKMLSSMPRSVIYDENDILEMYEDLYEDSLSSTDITALKGANIDGKHPNPWVLANTIFQTKLFTERVSAKLTSNEKNELNEIQDLDNKMTKHENRFDIDRVNDLPLTIELNREALRKNREMQLQESKEHSGHIRMEIR